MPATLTASRTLLKILIFLNILFGVLFLLILAGSFAAEAEVLARLNPERIDPASILTGIRAVMALGLVAVPLAHVLLAWLLAIVETVRAGDPFVAGNADRLAVIAWALLGLQILDLAFGAVALGMFSDAEGMGWTFSLTGWLAVLMLFVLARVFEQGARMREELAGTV